MGLLALSPEDISAPPGKMICKTAGLSAVFRQGRSHSRTARLLPALLRGKDLPSPQRKTGRLPVFLHNSLTKAVSRMHKTKKELQKRFRLSICTDQPGIPRKQAHREEPVGEHPGSVRLKPDMGSGPDGVRKPKVSGCPTIVRKIVPDFAPCGF